MRKQNTTRARLLSFACLCHFCHKIYFRSNSLPDEQFALAKLFSHVTTVIAPPNGRANNLANVNVTVS